MILVLKDISKNANPYFNVCIPNKGKLQQTEYGYAADIDSVRSRRTLLKNGTSILASKELVSEEQSTKILKGDRECIAMKNWLRKQRLANRFICQSP